MEKNVWIPGSLAMFAPRNDGNRKAPDCSGAFLLFAAGRCGRRNGHAGPGAFALHSALQEKETDADNDYGTHDHAQYSNSTTSTFSHLVLLIKNGNGHEAVMFPPAQSGMRVSHGANPDKMRRFPVHSLMRGCS
ncbi:MAG: hypothetical protein ACJAVZ_001488 [Afipia broomeae]|nr:MAG: hypothetical protein EKK35_13330 [Bradyrhizobiaceae bacterium]